MQIYISAMNTKTKDGDIREHRLIIGMGKPPIGEYAVHHGDLLVG